MWGSEGYFSPSEEPDCQSIGDGSNLTTKLSPNPNESNYWSKNSMFIIGATRSRCPVTLYTLCGLSLPEGRKAISRSWNGARPFCMCLNIRWRWYSSLNGEQKGSRPITIAYTTIPLQKQQLYSCAHATTTTVTVLIFDTYFSIRRKSWLYMMLLPFSWSVVWNLNRTHLALRRFMHWPSKWSPLNRTARQLQWTWVTLLYS